MMSIKVRFYSKLREITGTSGETVVLPDGASIDELLHRLTDQFGSAFQREVVDGVEEAGNPRILLLVNGKVVSPKEWTSSRLKSLDEVAFLYPAVGGAKE